MDNLSLDSHYPFVSAISRATDALHAADLLLTRTAVDDLSPADRISFAQAKAAVAIAEVLVAFAEAGKARSQASSET
ncbi:hypothetical protein K7Z75_24725 [Mycobacterium avium subsp. hominissuis]|uniref:hypothetical protein n=1 Tax=Mycobacterium avium TaxID=1764 RepID=UPI00293AF7A3|nr:hypothetical protein [Mycobacterium avium]MDV3306832.1 hypothetical protein [Mycobacterium avium subsp. hominissuis]